MVRDGHAIMTSGFLEVLLRFRGWGGGVRHFTTIWVVKLGHAIMTSFFLEVLLAAILEKGRGWDKLEQARLLTGLMF